MNRPYEDWPRLASYVVSARRAAGYRDRKEFAAATGITHRTLGKLENGQRVSPDTLAVVERQVGWKPDSARSVLSGGEPVPAAPAGEDDRRRHYDDPRLNAIEQLDFPEDVRRGMIRFAEGWLNIPPETGEAAQAAG